MTNHFFVRFLRWCIAKIGWVTILSLSLLIFIFGIVVYGLTETIRGVDSEMLFLLVFMGLLFGWWLGRFRLTWYWIVLAAIILGVGIISSESDILEILSLDYSGRFRISRSSNKKYG